MNGSSVIIFRFFYIPIQDILYVDRWCASLVSSGQILVVDFQSVISYHEQCHTRINVNAIHILLPLHFLVQNFEYFSLALVIVVMCNENKPTDYISNIMSKRHGFFTENFTIFVSNAGKTGIVPPVSP